MPIPPLAAAQPPLLLSALGSIALRVGDNDASRRWGGTVQSGRTGTPVRDMQRALASVGTYTAGQDGSFGPGTQLALRRFQWFVVNSRYRLRVPAGGAVTAGTVEEYVRNAAVQLTGSCDAVTATELLAWVNASVRTTTMLVRIPMARFSNIERSSTFTTLTYPNAANTEVLGNQGFVSGLDSLNTAASTNKVQLRLNQTFRVQNVAPTGAVVPPATRSQHLIGRAADLNIVDGQAVVTSAMFLNNTAPQKAKDLVKAAKDAGLRWGGDFSPKDPPHFDSQVAADTEDYTMNFFFCQRCFALRHPIRLLA